jgi:sugar phosphate isomerase/epimerase
VLNNDTPSAEAPVKIYATTYFRSIRLRDEHFRVLADNSLRAELYFQLGWDKHSLGQHRELAKTVAGELPGCGIHLPYDSNGSVHNLGDREEMDWLERHMEVAGLYKPDHVVGHLDFNALRDSASGVRKYFGQKKGPLDDQFHEPSGDFLERSTNWWKLVLAATPANVYLEHTHEHSPLPAIRLLDLLGTERAGFCLDLGHWHHFGMGKTRKNLPEWVKLVGPRLKHLHVHDNDGDGDQHLGLGQGTINLPWAWEELRKVSPHPNFTLENHRSEGLLQSLSYLRANPLF